MWTKNFVGLLQKTPKVWETLDEIHINKPPFCWALSAFVAPQEKTQSVPPNLLNEKNCCSITSRDDCLRNPSQKEERQQFLQLRTVCSQQSVH